jgi:hypothetical protein
MSITATVHDDNIKLPPGVHLPHGTKVVVHTAETSAAPKVMRNVPDFVARQEAAGMEVVDAKSAALLDKLIAGEE